MKKRSLFLSTLVCFLCLLLFACRKEIQNFTGLDTPNVSATKLDAAKIWNAKFVAKHISENSKIPGFITLAPQWDKAWTVSVANNREYLAVPTVDIPVDKINTTIRRAFLFELNNGNIENAQIVEFVGLNYDVANNLDYLIKNESSEDINGFNGAIIHYDLNYRWTAGNRIEDGRLKYRDAAITRKGALTDPSSNAQSPLFLSSVGKNMTGRLQIHNEMYLFTPSAQSSSTSGGSGSGSSGGGSGSTLSTVVVVTPPSGGGVPGGGGSGGGNPPPPPPPLR